MIQKMQDEDEPAMPQMATPMYDLDTPEYRARHALAQSLQRQSAREGYVLLKNSSILPLPPEQGSMSLAATGVCSSPRPCASSTA